MPLEPNTDYSDFIMDVARGWGLKVQNDLVASIHNGTFIDPTECSEWGVYNELMREVMALYDSITSNNHELTLAHCIRVSSLVATLGSRVELRLKAVGGP